MSMNSLSTFSFSFLAVGACAGCRIMLWNTDAVPGMGEKILLSFARKSILLATNFIFLDTNLFLSSKQRISSKLEQT